MSQTISESRINFRVAANLKLLIEQAAAEMGQSVSDFAISTLVQSAQSILEQSAATELSRRDRDQFIALLDDEDAKPNAALKAAAKKFR